MKTLNEATRDTLLQMAAAKSEGWRVIRTAIRDARTDGMEDMVEMLRGLPCDTDAQREGCRFAAGAIAEYVAFRRERDAAAAAEAAVVAGDE